MNFCVAFAGLAMYFLLGVPGHLTYEWMCCGGFHFVSTIILYCAEQGGIACSKSLSVSTSPLNSMEV